MNILQVCAYAAPYEGNFMKSLYALDNKLSQMGHSVIYAFCEYARNKEWVIDLQKKRRVFFLPQRYARINPLTYVRLKSIIKKEKIDVVHSHFELYDLPLGVVAPKRCKMFWHLHDTIEDNYYKENAFRKMLYKLQYKTFSKNAVLCSVSKKHMRFVMTLGFDESKTLYIPNAVDFNRLIEREKNKKYDRLCHVHKKLIENGIKHHIYIIGVGPQRKELEEYLYNNNIIDSFTFLGFRDNVYKYVAKADLFVCCSRREGFSTAVTESIIVGTPVLSTNCSGAYELLGENNEYGVVTDNNVDSLYTGLYRLLTSPNLLSHYRNQAKIRAKMFSKEKTVTAVEDMLLNL